MNQNLGSCTETKNFMLQEIKEEFEYQKNDNCEIKEVPYKTDLKAEPTKLECISHEHECVKQETTKYDIEFKEYISDYNIGCKEPSVSSHACDTSGYHNNEHTLAADNSNHSEVLPSPSFKQKNKIHEVNLQKNIMAISQTDTKDVIQYQCTESIKQVSEKEEMKSDFKVESEDDEYYKCGVCDMKFNCISQLEAHIKDEHIGNTAVKCGICDKKFRDTRTLKIHVNEYNKIAQYKCEHCGKMFSNSRSFRRHMSALCMGNKFYESYNCPECNRTFNMKRHLTTHINSLHKFVLNYVCNECGKLFTSEKYLKCHLCTKNK